MYGRIARLSGGRYQRLDTPGEVVHELPRIELADAWSPVRSAELSAYGGAWQPLTAEDGLLVGQREVLLVDRPADAKLLLLRVTDAAFNTMTFDLTRVTS